MRAVRLIALVVVAMSMIASLATAERRIAKLRENATLVERVDMGVTLVVVRKAPVDGTEIVRGLPRMLQVGEPIHFGGMVQIGGVPQGWTDAMGEPPLAFYVGRSRNPVVWHVSEQQARLIIQDDDLPLWTLIEGSEGSGKTTAGAMWLAIQALADIGTTVETGIVAPTGDRLGHIRKAISETWPDHWYRYHKNDDLYTWHAGPRFQCVSAAEKSKAGGSPLQGYTWGRALSDELQDHFDKNDDIVSRLRDPRVGGRSKRLCTSTMKDSAEWRTFREQCRASKPVEGETVPQWGVHRLLGLDSPFIWDRKWQEMRASGTMTEREWRRRVLALDVGPEKQVYFNWRRTFDNGRPANLYPVGERGVPENATDVTAQVLGRSAGNAAVLVGHDPGQRKQVSVLLKAFLLPGQRKGDDRPRWFVVDEITSPESTVLGHAQQVFTRLRDRWGCYATGWNGKPDPHAPTALVRIDPHTRGEGDGHPGADVATIWKSLGMTAKAAAYKSAPGGSVDPVQIKRRQRIDLVNTLLAATAEVGEVRRLFVAQGPDGKPVAPMLVKAFESMEFNAAGEAERERKDADDLSHWPAALGYALWAVEAPRLGMGVAA